MMMMMMMMRGRRRRRSNVLYRSCRKILGFVFLFVNNVTV